MTKRTKSKILAALLSSSVLLFSVMPIPWVPSAHAAGTFKEATSAAELVNALIAPDAGITIIGAPDFKGSLTAASTYSSLDLGSMDGVSYSLPAGILVTTGDGTPPESNTKNDYGIDLSLSGDADVEAFAGVSNSKDAFSLEFTFTVPEGYPAIQMAFMFGSDEYPEYLNDVVDGAAIIVDGINYAKFAGDIPLKVVSEAEMLPNNGLNIEYDGISMPKKINALLDSTRTEHTIKIVIADTTDGAYDTGLFLSTLKPSKATTGGIGEETPVLSDVATVTSDTYTVSKNGTSQETITGIPAGTTKEALLAGLSKDEEHQTWNTDDLSDPIETGDTLIVTAQDGVTVVTYTLSLKTSASLSNIATVTSDTYQVSTSGPSEGKITGIPSGTTKEQLLAGLTKGEEHQTWNTDGLSDPVKTGDTLIVTAEDGVTVFTYTIVLNSSSTTDPGNTDSGSSPGSGSTATPRPPGSSTGSQDQNKGTIVLVNGERKEAGKETATVQDGVKSVEVLLNSDAIAAKIEEVLNNEKETGVTGEHIVEVLVSSEDPDRLSVILDGDIVDNMTKHQFDLSVNAGNVKYIIPAEEISSTAVMHGLGMNGGNIKSYSIDLKINKADASVIERMQGQASRNGQQLLSIPTEFDIVATVTLDSGEVKEVSLSKFAQYVQRVMEIPSTIDPNKITTGIVFNKDGTFSHIPTEVFKQNILYYAKLNSMTNSAYAVIWNPLEVEAVEKHWSKTAVNDMASRLVVKNPETFTPDDAITRGEFAEYITKALGLFRTDVANTRLYSDVTEAGDLADAATIATAYGIITGYPDGTFRPNGNISREEAMTMYARAMDVIQLQEGNGTQMSAFKDADQVAGWAYASVKKTVSADIFNGRTLTTLAPKGTLSFAEAATAVRNLLLASKLINDSF